MSATPASLPPAVVIGLDSITGLQTARVLARRGISVVGLAAHRGHPSCRTNVCRQIVTGPTSGALLVDTLVRLGTGGESVLFPCTDLSVLTLSRHREALGKGCRAVLPTPGVIELLLDKARFHAHAVAHGLPVAASRVLASRRDAEDAAATLRFPCVLKPAVKTLTWHARTAAKVFRVETPSELLARYDVCRGWTETLVAQEWIEGPDTCHVTCNAYFGPESSPHLTFVSQKLRQWPLEGGVGCLSQECHDDVVAAVTAQVFGPVGHRGLAYLEMKRDARHGRHVIIEPNVGRPTGRSAAADAAGVPLLYAHYCDALGWPLPAPRSQPFGRRRWIYLRQDLQAAAQQMRRGRLTPGAWIRSISGSRDALFSWRDPAPFVADLHVAVKKALGDGQRSGTEPAAPVSVDFDVHGVVGVRLVGGTSADVTAVTRQLGAPVSALRRSPDIVVRFVHDLPIDGLRWVEVGKTGYTADGFFVLEFDKRPARARIPLDQVGGACEIVCQRGFGPVPLLQSIVNLTAIGRGAVPLHASAFVRGGVGIVVSGWAHGGKTGALLAFASDGIEFVGDDWILLNAEGRLTGIPQPTRIQGWHMRQRPELCDAAGDRRRLSRIIRRLDGLYETLAPVAGRRQSTVLGRRLRSARRRLSVQIDPRAVFTARALREPSPLDVVFFMVTHDTPEIQATAAGPADVACRMSASASFERLPLHSAYLAYRGAFPDRRNALLERADQLASAALERLLGARSAYIVRHPYPYDLQALHDTLAPLCSPVVTAAPLTEAFHLPAGLTPVPQG